MMLLHAHYNLRRIKARGVRLGSLRKAKHTACVVSPRFGADVLFGAQIGDLEFGPLTPEIHTCGCLHEFRNERSANARRYLEEVVAAISMSLDEFGVRHAGWTLRSLGLG